MLSYTAAQADVLQRPIRAQHVKVEVYNGAWIDLTNLFGYNFVLDVDVKDSIDEAIATATVKVVLRNTLSSGLNLSPFVQGSKIYKNYGTLCYPNNPIRISAASTAPNQPIDSWTVIFYGRIYQVDPATGLNEMTLSCHDWCGQLQSVFWPSVSFSFGSAAGTLAETVMQTLLTYITGGTVYRALSGYSGPTSIALTLGTLYSVNGTGGTPFNPSDSPNFKILTYTQDIQDMYTALQNIALQTGWLLKQKWQKNVGAFELMWFDPQRGNTTSLWEFYTNNYIALTQCSLGLDQVRNIVSVPWLDQNNNPNTTYAYSSSSITSYGAQWIQVAPQVSQNTFTSTAATNLATAIVTDLALPLMTHVATMPIFWPVELCDVYTFQANNEHYDSNQVLAVTGFEHHWSSADGQMATTTLSLSGAPRGGFNTWLSRQAINSQRVYGAKNQNLYVEGTGNLCANGLFGQGSRF